MKPKRFRIDTASIASEKHPNRNEDAYFVLPNYVLGVCDGLGGHPGSEHASAYVSAYCQGALGRAALTDIASTEHVLTRTLRDADRGLTREFSGSTATQDIATTAILAALLWDEATETGTLCTTHAGDCRGHLHREGQIIFTTLDHSLTHTLPLDEQRLIQDEIAKEHYVHDVDPYDWPYLWQRNIVTSSLKANYSHKQLRIDTDHVEIRPGDTILLSSDGIHDNLTTDEIASILSTAAHPAFALVDAAQQRSREPREQTIMIDDEEHEVDYFRPKPDDMTAVTLQIR
jgi:serine/threonine protein phosphatase PrpC